jgi:hypothetical protein
LVVVDYIAQMVSAAVVCSAHAHGVVREVDIAVVACSRVAVSAAGIKERVAWRGVLTKDCGALAAVHSW